MARYADHGLLAMALVGYESERAKIKAAITEIRAKLGQRGPGRPKVVASETEQAGPQKRAMSASSRRRIAMAQRKRWAAIKNAKAPAKPKRKLSAAGGKAIVEALRKRWAAVSKAKAQKSGPKGRKAAA